MWETIDGKTERLSVLGGWLVRTWMNVSESCALAFVPDPAHEWNLEQENLKADARKAVHDAQQP